MYFLSNDFMINITIAASFVENLIGFDLVLREIVTDIKDQTPSKVFRITRLSILSQKLDIKRQASFSRSLELYFTFQFYFYNLTHISRSSYHSLSLQIVHLVTCYSSTSAFYLFAHKNENYSYAQH